MSPPPDPWPALMLRHEAARLAALPRPDREPALHAAACARAQGLFDQTNPWEGMRAALVAFLEARAAELEGGG